MFDKNETTVTYCQAGSKKKSDNRIKSKVTELVIITFSMVNWQGVDRLGDGLTVEARAPDGLVEAFRVTDAEVFAIAVQWHPEWRAGDDALSSALLRAFGDACRERANKRRCV